MSVRPITVANASFTLDANARDCPPLQFVREFTINGLEAIAARRAQAGMSNPGVDRVVWRAFTELADKLAAPKLACIDTGIGMTPDEMDRYIRSLASTSKRQALDGNYGWGAKISAAEANPVGLTYISWTGSPESGSTCTLAHDATQGEWGLLQNAAGEMFVSVDPELCPPEIRQADWRGTAVVFMGRAADQDTTQAPDDDLGADWLLKAINTRFYELPEDIEVRCQRPEADEGARRAWGQKVLLDAATEQSGRLRLSDATVHWRILTDDHDRRKKNGGRWAAVGHRAALHDNELYELRTATAGGYRKLQEFGIHFGYKRVVLYLEPDGVTPDSVRARLLRDHPTDKDLPWERWADEFTADMPKPLADLVARSAGSLTARDRREFMRRLQEIAAEMPLPTYRADAKGDLHANPTHGGTPEGEENETDEGERQPGEQAGSAHGGNVLSLFTRNDGPAARRRDADQIPDIKPIWVTVEDGSRDHGVMDDRGASFLPRDCMVQLNADFRGYEVLLKYFRARYGHLGGIDNLIVTEVQSACEDLVIEFIVGILRLRCQPYGLPADEEHALDERALTGCLMQHATLAARIDERLARRLRRRAA
jgi:hypothetical protein